MALRHREIASTISDGENLTTRLAKAHFAKQPSLTRRPALNELSNKLNATKPNTTQAAQLIKKTKVTRPVKKDEVPVKDEVSVKAYSSQQLDTIISETESDDPQMVSEYLPDIFQYLLRLETKYPIREKFLEGHSSTPRMRSVLVNWLVEVHTSFTFCLETLHLTISLVDRYLQDHPKVGRQNLQLVGTSAFFIAAKYEEMYIPEVSDFRYLCDNSFTKEEILNMEKSILLALDYSLGKPLSIHFLRRYSKIAQVRLDQHNLAKYLLELALLDHSFSLFRPSIQAAAACCLSISILNNLTCPSKAWTLRLVHFTTYKYSDFKHIVHKLAGLLIAAESSKFKSVQKKYAHSKFSRIGLNSKLKGDLVKKLAESSAKA